MPARVLVDPRFGARLRELRRARGMSLRELAAHTHFSKSHLHDFETGRRTPSLEHAARLDSTLRAGGTLAGLVDTGPLAYAVEHPRRVDHDATEQLAEQLAAARVLEDEVGPVPLLPAAAARVDTLTDLARQARGDVRPQLVTLAGQWAQFAGWLHIATGRYHRAGLLLDRALEWAVETGDRDLVATVLSFKGHAAWLAGVYGPLVGLTEAALRDPTIHVGQRAYDEYQLARGYAATGDRAAAAEHLASGVDLAAEAVEYTGPRPPWHYYRSAGFFDLEHGLVRALLGEHTQARELVDRGLAGLGDMAGAEWTGMYRDAVRE